MNNPMNTSLHKFIQTWFIPLVVLTGCTSGVLNMERLRYADEYKQTSFADQARAKETKNKCRAVRYLKACPADTELCDWFSANCNETL